MQKAIFCFGDSLTKGNFSFNWIEKLKKMPENEKFYFINYGSNGIHANDLLKKIQFMVEQKPNKIIIMIGSNDIKSIVKGNPHAQYAEIKLKIDNVVNTVNQILIILKNISKSDIAIISIPPQGENFESFNNELVEYYNKKLELLSKENNIYYVKFYENIKAELLKSNAVAGEYIFDKKVKIKTVIKRFLLFHSWNRISENNGYTMLTDSLHLNERAGNILIKLLSKFLV